MRLLQFMLLMPLSALAHLTPSTTPAKKGDTFSPRTQTAKNGNVFISQAQTKTNVETVVTVTTGPYQKDCDHWYRNPQVREWGGISKVVKDARKIVDLVLSVRNGTTTEVGLLGPEELKTLERRYFGELDALETSNIDRNLQRVQGAWDRTTSHCRDTVCLNKSSAAAAFVDRREWIPVVNICPFWWDGSKSWRELVNEEDQIEAEWGAIREAALIHEMLHLRIVHDPKPIVDLQDRWNCPPGDGDCAVYGPLKCQVIVLRGFDATRNADNYSMYIMNIWMGSIFGLPPAFHSQTGRLPEATGNPLHHPHGTCKLPEVTDSLLHHPIGTCKSHAQKTIFVTAPKTPD